MTGGEDWLEWTSGIEWGPRWDENRARLDDARKSAGGSGGLDDGAANIIEFSDRTLMVGPGGGRLGKGSRAPYLPWRFDCEGMGFMLADRPSAHKHLPSLHVRIDGRACLMASAFGLWNRAKELVQMMGGTIVWERISRVDLCLDMPGQSIEPFKRAHFEDRYITRAKGKGYRDGSGLTLYIGSAPPLLRIYDKLAEVIKGGDGLKRSLMAFHRWGGMEPEAATRVEFELNRKALRARGVESVMDYYERRGDLADYLCTQWVRFTECTPDRTHTTRAATLALWDQVRAGFLEWTGKPSGIPLTPMPRELADPRQLVRSMIGMGLTAAAMQDARIGSDGDLVRYIMSQVIRELGEMDWAERLRRKKLGFPSEA